jgi:hypothetical protein
LDQGVTPLTQPRIFLKVFNHQNFSAVEEQLLLVTRERSKGSGEGTAVEWLLLEDRGELTVFVCLQHQKALCIEAVA